MIKNHIKKDLKEFRAEVNERFDNTNGQYASDEVPIIRWLSAVRKLEFSTILNEPDEDTVSLLPYFLEMK